MGIVEEKGVTIEDISLDAESLDPEKKENHSRGPRPVYIHRYRRCGDTIIAGATLTGNRGAGTDKEPGFMVDGLRLYER